MCLLNWTYIDWCYTGQLNQLLKVLVSVVSVQTVLGSWVEENTSSSFTLWYAQFVLWCLCIYKWIHVSVLRCRKTTSVTTCSETESLCRKQTRLIRLTDECMRSNLCHIVVHSFACLCTHSSFVFFFFDARQWLTQVVSHRIWEAFPELQPVLKLQTCTLST